MVELPTALTVSALLAGVALVGVALARRRQQRRRRPGRQVATPSRGAARLERAYRAAAPRADITVLDLALRSLAAALAQRPDDGAGPDILGAWLGPEQLRLILAEPCAPAFTPFTATADGLEWILPVEADLPVTAETAGHHLAPLPTLASVGRAGDEQLLVDLERLGVLEISGHPERGRSLLRHLAAELAHSTWADALEVVLVGFGADLTALNPDRIRHIADRSQAIEHLRARLTRARHALADLQPGSVLDGRVHDVAGDAWMPEVLLISDEDAPDGGETDRGELDALLAEVSCAGRATVAVVAARRDDDPVHGWRAHIDVDGSMRLPLTTHVLRAEGIPAEIVPYLVELFAVTDAEDEPIPPADDPSAWAQGMDGGGSLLHDLPGTVAEANTTEAAPGSRVTSRESADAGPELQPEELLEFEDSAPELERPLDDDLAYADSGRQLQATPATRDPDGTLAQVEQLDPALDDDVADYHRAEATRPLIGILGEPQVRAPGEPPRYRVPWYSEVLVYLALHPHGVTTDHLMTDLWPEGQTVAPVTLRQALSTARKWAGNDPSGRPYVSTMSADGIYRLRGHLFDWDLFRRLRKRAEARRAAGHRGARDDYVAALRLIRGAVLQPQRPGRYTWLAEPDQQHELLIPGHIIDTAHDLVELALAGGDHDLANWAVQVALLVDRDRTSERPIVDQMRVLHAEGRQAEAERVATQLLTLTEVDVPEDLQPDTYRTFRELFPGGLRATG